MRPSVFRTKTTSTRSVIGILFAVCVMQQPAYAKTPRNPERLLKVNTCEQAKRNLIEAKLGSPLISAAKNDKIVAELQMAVKRLCVKQRKT